MAFMSIECLSGIMERVWVHGLYNELWCSKWESEMGNENFVSSSCLVFWERTIYIVTMITEQNLEIITASNATLSPLFFLPFSKVLLRY